MTDKNVIVVGAGLVGSLLSILLAKRGYQVSVFERRADSRKKGQYGGRSINLALSSRGLRGLEKAGLLEQVSQITLPMKGRIIHQDDGEQSFQPYGKAGQAINSISRSDLNHLLIEEAEKLGVEFHFQRSVAKVDFDRNVIQVTDDHQMASEFEADLIIGADGAFSAVRSEMQKSDRFNYDQHYLGHGYKELTIPSTASGDFQMAPGGLHIWPREKFMLIALPNLDRSFTCTLFLPFEGERSFEHLNTASEIEDFFRRHFEDALGLMPDLVAQFQQNPTSSLVTIRCQPWHKENVLLIGDSSHAIVPFYGQGMNAGFEDCRILIEMLEVSTSGWKELVRKFFVHRKPDADAIRELALQNFVEMMEHVADPSFLLRKRIEAHLHDLYPHQWIPQYSQVTFSHIPYSQALAQGEKQRKIMDEVMKIPDIDGRWQDLDYAHFVRMAKD